MWNSKQGPEHDFGSYTKVFGFGPRVKEEMWQILRRTELTRFGISGSSLYRRSPEWGIIGRGEKTRDRDQLEAVVVQERDTVAWPKVMVMGMERRGTAKGHSAD